MKWKEERKAEEKIKAFSLLCFSLVYLFYIYSIQIYIFFRCVLFVSYLNNKIILKTIRINKVLQCRSFGHYTVFSTFYVAILPSILHFGIWVYVLCHV